MKGRICIDGYKFTNEHEYKRYLGVMELVKAGRIKNLDVKPQFPLTVNETLVDHYIPSFHFFDPVKNQERFIQVMGGTHNPTLELRIRLFEALYNHTVERWG
mgnify:CR=1 FL=1